MYVMDEQNLICPNFEHAGIELASFVDRIRTLDLAEFLKLPLERRNEIILINAHDFFSRSEKLNELKSILNTFLTVFFFWDAEKELSNFQRSEIELIQNVFDFISLPMKSQKSLVLSKQLNLLVSLISDQKNLQNHIAKISFEINELFKGVVGDYEVAKKISKSLLPQRSEKIKGICFSTKYESGPAGGGEFFDMIHEENKVFLVLIHSDSYLISSSLMGILNQLKKSQFSSESFWDLAQKDIEEINKSKKKKAFVDLLILELNLKDLSIKKIGSSSIVGVIKKDQYKEFNFSDENQLQKGDILIIPSIGFYKNWHFVEKCQLAQDLNENFEKQDMELINYLFYRLKTQKQLNDFKKDSTVLMMEVKRHGIHQV